MLPGLAWRITAIAQRSHGDTVFGVKRVWGIRGGCERLLRADDGVGVDEQLAGDGDEDDFGRLAGVLEARDEAE